MTVHKKSYKFIAMALWVLALTIFTIWFKMDTAREENQKALKTANSFFQMTVITRDWNASHGGVYAPITEKTLPNPYLPSKNRDLTISKELKLTKINPAYMTRQIADLAKNNPENIQFHITSLNPINPKNKATKLEERWLKSFEQGTKEQGEFFEEDNAVWFRYMAPLYTTKHCLKCHTQQGYKVGDVRGGISVAIPYPPCDNVFLFFGLGFVGVTGLILIFISGQLYERKQRLFDATFNSPIPTCVTGKDYTILMANDIYWQTFGVSQSKQKHLKCYEHRPGSNCHSENCALTRIMNGEVFFSDESSKEINGTEHHYIVTPQPLYDHNNNVIGCVESFQDITERNHMESELKKANEVLEKLSLTDGLTKISNRRHFDHVLDKEYARHRRSSAQLSIIMLDIDYFKPFNDHYGHVKGDECLQQIAQALNDCATRPGDLAARYGGEEFICILPETGYEGAFKIAQSIQEKIKVLAIPHEKSEVADCITVSLGLVSTQCTFEKTSSDLVHQVDELLYNAKCSGRNCIQTNFSDATIESSSLRFILLN